MTIDARATPCSGCSPPKRRPRVRPGLPAALSRRLLLVGGAQPDLPGAARLERAGWCGTRVVDGAGPRETKRYRITAAGRRDVRAWLRATTPEVDDREILLRVYLLFVLRPAGGRSGSSRRSGSTTAGRCEEYLGHRSDDDPAAQGWGPDVTVAGDPRLGSPFEQGRIRWCDELLADLGARPRRWGGRRGSAGGSRPR